MKYYLIAGEPSGDLHGSNLMKALSSLDNKADYRFWGGDHMLSVDEGLITHIRETSIMGFVEVAKKLPQILSFFRRAKRTILEFQPDVIVLIDYPGFNLRMAKWAKRKGFKVVYYISPQLWAWKKGRIKIVKDYVDEMLVILPFEASFYAKNQVPCHFVGHPLLPVIRDFKPSETFISENNIEKPILAILPGSRKQEIQKMLPVFLSAARALEGKFEVVIAGAPNIEASFYKVISDRLLPSAKIVFDETYNLLSHAKLAIVTSGTATLETALFKVPQVVCYKTSGVNYTIGRLLIDLKYICLVNLILDEEVVPELIQSQMTSDNIVNAIGEIENDVTGIELKYERLFELLTTDQDASHCAAKIIFNGTI